jgi:Phage integrase family
MVMNGVDLPTVKEILGHSEINMTMRYSHLAPAHKAKAVQQLGDALEQIAQGPLKQQAEAATPIQTSPNLAHFRHVLVVKSGRGLSVIEPKTQRHQRVNTDQDWWRRGESNPRPKVFRQI